MDLGVVSVGSQCLGCAPCASTRAWIFRVRELAVDSENRNATENPPLFRLKTAHLPKRLEVAVLSLSSWSSASRMGLTCFTLSHDEMSSAFFFCTGA